MDFLLECIGFPPGQDSDELIERVRIQGEPVPWRGDPENHKRLEIGPGLELRLDREPGQDFWTLLPHCQVPHRLRVAAERIDYVPDSPFDALLVGWACPPAPDAPDLSQTDGAPGAYRLCTWLSDARRLPRRLRPGHVLAVSIAGFAIEVDAIVPNAQLSDPTHLERRRGAWIAPLGRDDEPGGCAEVSVRVKEIRRVKNRLTGNTVQVVIADAPERPLVLFLSPWQLERDGLEQPRPGWRIEGTFFFTGRITGGLPRVQTRRSFG
ncbi:MAG: hypothetical protein GY711_19990 [bacterium]|nr:hypothetical protein [bacterium]